MKILNRYQFWGLPKQASRLWPKSLQYGEEMQVTLEQMKKTTTANDHALTKTSYRAGMGNQRIESTGQKARDISSIYAGSTEGGMNAYRSHGKTTKDIQEAAKATDASVLQDKMVVMSHCVSSKEFGEMMQDGFSPESMHVDEYVTIVDRIKIEEAKSGKVVAGYNDSLDDEMLREAAGGASGAASIKNAIQMATKQEEPESQAEKSSEDLIREALQEEKLPESKENMQAAKQALEMGEELDAISGATKKYLVENQLVPSIENIYTAQYSGSVAGKQSAGYFEQDGTGYLAEKSVEEFPDALTGQLKELLTKEGVELTEANLMNAKWLVEEGIPVTQENIECAVKIDTVTLPKTREEYAHFAVERLHEGEIPKKVEILPVQPREIVADGYEKRFSQISEDAVDKVVDEQKPLDLKHLEKAQKEIEADENTFLQKENSSKKETTRENQIEADKPKQDQMKSTLETTKAYRLLEEVRLHMTAEAAMRLGKQGIHIDTTELTKLVDELKRVEGELAKALFPEEEESVALEKYRSFDTTEEAIKAFPQMPASFLGVALLSEDEVTLERYYEAGQSQQLSMEAAKERYETFMTVARADMGDSMKKAFRNMADILQETGVEDTPENERAARILAYNHLEITEESLQVVKEADSELQYVVKELDPAMVLSMIRDGANPMKMTLQELSQRIDQYERSEERETKRFSKFLYELEHKKGITPEERAAFMEVYRTFKQIDRTEGAAIGSLLNQGAELTLDHLRTATRSGKKQVDYTLDDQKFTKNQYLRDAKLIYHTLDVDGLSEMKDPMNRTLEEYKEQFSGLRQETEGYVKEQMQTMSDAAHVSEEAFQKLMDQGLPVTEEYLLAQERSRNKRGSLYQDLAKMIPDKLGQELEKVQENFTDEESVNETYGQMLKDMDKLVSEQIEEAETYVDLKAMNQIMKQISIAQAAKEQHEYEIPLKIGEELTSVHVILDQSEDGSGKVTVTTDTERYGKMGASLQGKERGITGYLAAETKEGQNYLEEHMEGFIANLTKINLETHRIQIVHSPQMDLSKMEERSVKDQENRMLNDTYFKVAKAFLVAIHQAE